VLRGDTKQPSVTQVYRAPRPNQPTDPNPAPPAPLAYMSGRAPRIGEHVVVWTKLQDLVKDHPQLKGRVSGFFPAGFVGKWIKGTVEASVTQVERQRQPASASISQHQPASAGV
jgi:hypothetical protein